MTSPIHRVFNRVQHSTAVATSSAPIVESNGMATVQVQTHNGAQTLSDVPVAQQYGFASQPLPGARHILIAPSGDKTQAVSIASNDGANRPPAPLLSGDAQMHDASGQYIHLTGGKSLNANASQTINLTAGQTVNINIGSMTVLTLSASGAVLHVPLTVSGDVTANGISLIQHVHPGVASGDASTGLPVG